MQGTTTITDAKVVYIHVHLIDLLIGVSHIAQNGN